MHKNKNSQGWSKNWTDSRILNYLNTLSKEWRHKKIKSRPILGPDKPFRLFSHHVLSTTKPIKVEQNRDTFPVRIDPWNLWPLIHFIRVYQGVFFKVYFFKVFLSKAYFLKCIRLACLLSFTQLFPFFSLFPDSRLNLVQHMPNIAWMSFDLQEHFPW